MYEILPYKDRREYYLKNAEKIKARSLKRYNEKKDEILAKIKEDRKKKIGKTKGKNSGRER